MPVSFQIIPQRGLVYVTCSGHVLPSESRDAFGRYLAHPDFREGQAHLIDTAAAQGYGEIPEDQLELQARLADAMPRGPVDLVLAYYAPNRAGLEMAQAALRAWDGIPFARVLVGETEEAVLDMLGLPERRLADLRALALRDQH